jgi:hypothetical protein
VLAIVIGVLRMCWSPQLVAAVAVEALAKATGRDEQ